MSLMEKVGSLMRRPGEDVVPKDEVPVWLKYGGRAVGTVAGGLAIFFGIWNCFSIITGSIDSLISGMLQMLAGFVVLMIEAPCCCFFIDFVHTFSDWADKKPYWHRAGLYMAIAILPILVKFGITSFLGGALIFGTGVLYGMMALGKKASLEEMRARAAEVDGTLTKSKSNLVENASPIATSYVLPV